MIAVVAAAPLTRNSNRALPCPLGTAATNTYLCYLEGEYGDKTRQRAIEAAFVLPSYLVHLTCEKTAKTCVLVFVAKRALAFIWSVILLNTNTEGCVNCNLSFPQHVLSLFSCSVIAQTLDRLANDGRYETSGEGR